MTRRGRPPKTEKKGKPSWRPASMLDVPDKMPGFRPRWCSNDPLNLQRKKAEGWIPATEINGIRMTHDHPDKMGDGHPLTSVTEYRDMILMALPEDLAEARDEYFQQKTDAQTGSLKINAEEEAAKTGPDARVHGKIVIE